MKVICLIVINLMFLQPIWTACGEGTLRCNADDQALTCDASLGYTLTEHVCEKKTVEGCSLISYSGSGECAICEDGKILDTTSVKCIAVPSDSIVDDCAVYDMNNKSCTRCAVDFYVNSSDCARVGDTKVENCMVYSTASACSICQENYYLKGADCIEIKLVAGCQTHTEVKCLSCASEYALDQAFETPRDVTTLTLTGMYTNSVPQWTASNTQSVCRGTTLTHCLTLETFEKCSQCDSGYFLTSNKQCELFPEVGTPFCIEPKTSDLTKCRKCQDMYYVNANDSDKCTAITPVTDCELYMPGDDLCKKCKQDKFVDMESTKNCIDRQNTVLNCEVYSDHLDECKTCQTGFSRSDDNLGCLDNTNHNNCTVSGKVVAALKTDTHTCNACDTKFYLVGAACVELGDNCSEMTAAGVCSKCIQKYKLESNQCTNKSTLDCETFSTGDTCIKCLPNFTINSGTNTCTAFATDLFCKTSDDSNVNVRCLTCAGDRKLDGIKCTGGATVTDCDTNIVNSNTGCSSCNNNKALLNVFTAGEKEIRGTETGDCLQFSTDGSCVQCKSGMYLPSAGGTCTDHATADGDLICLIKTKDNTTKLSDPAACDLCNMSLGYVSTGGACIYEPNVVNCDQKLFEDPNYTCNKCLTSNYFSNEKVSICIPATFTPINGCQTYESLTECKVCEPRYLFSSPTSCTPIADTSVRGNRTHYDLNLNPITSGEVTAEITNCSEFVSTESNGFACKKCITDFVGIIAEIVSGSLIQKIGDAFNFSNEGTENMTYISTWNQIESCVTKTHSASTASGAGTDITANNCLLGFQVDGGLGGTAFVCQRCFNNYTGTIKKFEYFPNSNRSAYGIEANFGVFGIAECMDNKATVALDTYQVGAGYSLVANDSIVTVPNFINVTSCGAENFVVYNAVYTASTQTFVYNSTNSSNIPNNFICLPTTVNTSVDNCAVFARKTDATIDFSSVNVDITLLECIACKPTYKFSKTGIAKPTCVAISDCTSSTWLNACSIPKSTHCWAYDAGTKTVLYDELAANNGDTQCLVINKNGNQKCVLCKRGHYINQDSEICVPIVATNCLTPGIGLSGIFDGISATYRSGAAARHTQKTGSTEVDGICNVCDSGYVLFRGKDKQKCSPNNVLPEVELKSDCLRGDLTNSTCEICTTSAHLNPSGACTSNSSKTGCAKINSTPTCTECHEGYTLSDSFACEMLRCDEFTTDATECLICDPTKMSTAGEKKDCSVAIATDCKLYSPSLGHCIKCANDAEIPQVNKTTGASPTTTYSCITIPTGITSETSKGFGYLEATDGTISKLKFVLTANFKKRAENPPSSPLLDESLCILRTDSDCLTYKINSLYCQDCKPGYFIGSTDRCETISVGNCDEGDDSTTCTKCATGHFLLSSSSCQSYSPDLHCKTGEEKTDEDKCLECDSARYLDPVTKKCIVRQNICKTDEGKTDEDECNECDANKYAPLCLPYTVVINCLEYSDRGDYCDRCNEGYYKNRTSNSPLTYECRLNPDGIENCAKYSDRLTCIGCSPDFWLSSNTCVGVIEAAKIGDCSLYSNATTCSKCTGSKVLVANTCITDTLNCLVYKSADKCESCPPTKFLDNSDLCIDNAKTNCEVANSVNDKCVKCSNTFYLTDDGSCLNNTPINNCNVYKSPTECETCTSDHILSKDGTTCATIGDKAGTNCSTAVEVAEPVCELCGFGFKKDGKGGCDALVDSNCGFTDASDECLMCNIGSYMKKDKTCTKPIVVKPAGVSIRQSFVILTLLTMFLNQLF